MKRLLFGIAAAILLFPAAPTSKAADVSFDFFYNNMSGGSWIEVGDYGYCWQPDVAVSDTSWRPYSDGYWTYTDLGWTWVSYEDFGWATYHYGRWARLADRGWVWVPGRDSDLAWGPAWVSWRTGGDYIGWAPLPPETTGVVYEGRPVGDRVDVEFGIGPAWYNFVDVRYIGAPVLRERIVSVNENVTYVNQTVNVTNITYKNNSVYNYGPDYNMVNAHASQPVQRLTIERQQNVDFATAAKSGALVKPQGDKLVVGAPMRITKPSQTLAPPNVKTKVAKANVDKGWGIVSDPATKTQLEQKMKTEDHKQAQIGTNASGATGAQTNGAGASANANLNAGASASVAPGGHGRGKNALPPAGANATNNSNVNAGASVPPTQLRGRGKTGAQTNLPPDTKLNTETNASTGVDAGASVPPTQLRGRGKTGPQTNLPPNTKLNTETNASTGASVPPTDATGAKGKHDKSTGAQWRQNPNAELTAPPTSATATGDESGALNGGKIDRHKAKPIPTQGKNDNLDLPNKHAADQTTGAGVLNAPGGAKHLRGVEQPPLGNPNVGGNPPGPTNPPKGKHDNLEKVEKVPPGPGGPDAHGRGPGKNKEPVTSPTP